MAQTKDVLNKHKSSKGTSTSHQHSKHRTNNNSNNLEEWSDDTLDDGSGSDNVAKPLDALGNWLKAQATWLFSSWLFTSRRFPSTLNMYTYIYSATNRYGSIHSELDETERKRRITTLRFENLLPWAVAIEGFDELTENLTYADGTVLPEEARRPRPWQIQLVALIGLPSRPRTIDSNWNPQYVSAWQLFLDVLSNMCGGLPFPKETISGQKTVKKEDTVTEESLALEIVSETQSFYQYRWTEKQRLLLILSIIRAPLFFIFNLLIWPFKLVRNLLKLVTEALVPVISFYLAVFNLTCIAFFSWSLKAYMHSSKLKKLLGSVFWLPLVVLPALAISVAVGVVQYASIWACRIGIAFSSPIKSAAEAWHSGLEFQKNTAYANKVKLSRKIISYILASLGVALSAALSIATWSIVLPFAFSALVAAIPALLTPISWASQLPFIANLLGWLTQLPLVVGVTTGLQTAFGIVGTALATTFGPAIAGLGTLVAVTIPEAIMVFALSISFIVMPLISAITIGVEKLSDRFIQWVEERPFHNLITWLKSFKSPSPEKSADPKIQIDKREYYYLHAIVVYQAEPGKEYVLQGITKPGGVLSDVIPKIEVHQLKVGSEKLEDAAKKAEKIAEAIVITNLWHMKHIWERAQKNTDHSSTQKVRFLTDEEISSKRLNS